jgi:hypothetical protein
LFGDERRLRMKERRLFRERFEGEVEGLRVKQRFAGEERLRLERKMGRQCLQAHEN